MPVRNVNESDHPQIISVIDSWWGGRPMASMLPKLFFQHFQDTSYVVEENGDLLAFHSNYDGLGHPRVLFSRMLKP